MNKLLCSSLREQAEGSVESRGAELDVLAEMTAALRADNDPRDALMRLLELVGELLPYNQAAVYLYDRDQSQLRPVATVGTEVDLIQGVEFELGQGFSAWVAGRETPILLADLQRPVAPGELPLKCFMSAPILVNGELMGVINIGAPEPRAFEEDHLRLLTVIGGMLAATLTRAEAERLLGELAACDPLTEVLTHRFLDQRIGEEIDRSRRYGDALTLGLFKLEGLDAMTQTYGPKLGRQMVADFGRVCRETVRNSDVIGRVGDDEIAVMFVHTSAADARIAAERLAQAVAAHSFPRRKRLRAGYSLAAFPEGGEDLNGLLVTVRRRLRAPEVEVAAVLPATGALVA